MLEGNDQRLCGAHAFASDCGSEASWALSGTAFGNTVDHSTADRAPADRAPGDASHGDEHQGSKSGSQEASGRYTFLRRERPHLILDTAALPTHIVSGVTFFDGVSNGVDGCFTLVQPIGQPEL